MNSSSKSNVKLLHAEIVTGNNQIKEKSGDNQDRVMNVQRIYIFSIKTRWTIIVGRPPPTGGISSEHQ